MVDGRLSWQQLHGGPREGGEEEQGGDGDGERGAPAVALGEAVGDRGPYSPDADVEKKLAGQRRCQFHDPTTRPRMLMFFLEDSSTMYDSYFLLSLMTFTAALGRRCKRLMKSSSSMVNT